MRKPLLTLIAAALLTASVSAQNWHIVTLPTNDHLTGLDFVTPSVAFACTNTGQVAKTLDGGRTWTLRRVAAGVQLEDISFANANTGVVCGKAGALYRTIDGGETWTGVSPVGRDTARHFFSVELFDPLTGLVTGLDRTDANPFASMAYRTADGGKTWKKLDPMGMGFSEVFYSPETGVAFPAIGQLIRSSDLGKTWRQLQAFDKGLARDVGIAGNTIIMAGPNGFVGYSSDGGTTWSNAPQAGDRHFYAVATVDARTAFIGGTVMMYSADGGQNWTDELLPRSFVIFDLAVVGKRVYAVGTDGAMIYKDLK